ncbi:hypothetical protein FQZ97_1149520 [compost metagenome]
MCRCLAGGEGGEHGFGFCIARPQAFLRVACAGAHQVIGAVGGFPVHAAAHGGGLGLGGFERLKAGAGVDVLAPGVVANVLKFNGFPYKFHKLNLYGKFN